MTALTAALLAVAIAPLFAVEIPAMLDYTNHLARMYILSGGSNPAYEVRWGLYPDLAMDMIVPVLARWMSVATATKVFLGASEVLVVTGAVFLELTTKGRHRLSGLGALLALFTLPFAWGQVNFMFGMGLAVWGVAFWIWLRDEPIRIRCVAHSTVVAILFISHFFDLGVYGLTIGLYELSRIKTISDIRSLPKTVIFTASPVLVLIAVMGLTGGGLGPHGGGIGSPAGFDWDFFLKLGWAAIFMNVYDTRLAILDAGALFVLALALVATRRLSLTGAGVWIASGLAATYIALPRQLFGSQYLDVRLLTAAMIILPAFATFSPCSRLWRVAPLVAVLAIIATNEFVTTRAWFNYDSDIKEFEASFALLPRQSAVLIGQRDDAGREYQPIYYAATLAAPTAGVFVSSLFAQLGMQPIQPRAKFRGLAVKEERDCYPPRLALLRAATKKDVPPTIPENIVNWPGRFQYLYLLGVGGPNPFPTNLTTIMAGRRFSLYRIELAP
jgi:hypothetical protein